MNKYEFLSALKPGDVVFTEIRRGGLIKHTVKRLTAKQIILEVDSRYSRKDIC